MKKPTVFLCAVSVTILAALGAAPAAEWRGDWEKALQGAKTEGKIVLAIGKKRFKALRRKGKSSWQFLPAPSCEKNWSRC